MFRTIITPTNNNLLIQLPVGYVGQEIEIIAFPFNEAENTAEKYSWNEIEDFFKKNSIDLSNFKFNRDEANER